MRDSQDRRRRQETRFGELPRQNLFQDVCDPLRQGGSPRDTILMSVRKPMGGFVRVAGRSQVRRSDGSDSCSPEHNRGGAGLQTELLSSGWRSEGGPG